MSYDEITLKYDLAEDMARTFSQGAEHLQGTLQEMRNLGKMIEDGALLGRGGTSFTDAIQSNLCPSINKLIEQFQKLEKDVQAAIAYMRAAEAQAQAKLKV